MSARLHEGTFGSIVCGNVTNPGRTLTWVIDVDWDGDGKFNGVNEAITYDSNGVVTNRLQAVSVIRGRQFFVKSGGTGFEDTAIGTVALTLKDLDGRFNPYNASSPIYSYLQQNQKIMVRLEDTATAIVYWAFVGYIDDIRPNLGKYVTTATITASDGLKKLQNKTVNSQLVYQTIRYNNAITQVLADAGWSDQTSIDNVSSDTLTYWWESGRSALAELQDLTNASFGDFCVTANGTAKYLSSIATDASVTTFTESDIQFDYGIQVPSPRETIKNWIKIFSRSRTAQSLAVLWKASGTSPSISPGASLTVWATYSSGGATVAATSVTTPVMTTDYLASDGAVGDKTAQISVAFTPFATTAKIVYTNNDAGTVYMTLMQVRGIAITADIYTFAQTQDDASIASYTERDLTIQTDWLQDINTAVDKALTMKLKLAHPRQFPRFMVKRNSLAKSFVADLYNVVTANFTTNNISDEFRVGYITHNWSIQEPMVLDTTLYMEPNLFANASGTWIFPALIGTTTKFA